ncbi:MAG: PPC domain-containing protein, partial [Anaerolineae bacterium]|nr:PPC domain-containing protein [Anaerolineae bacterium]
VEGILEPSSNSQTWAFDALAGDRVNVVINGQFDSFLELYTPNGTLLASNDDNSTSLDASLFDIQIQQDGQHFIVVRGYIDAASTYALALTGGHPTESITNLGPKEPRAVVLSPQGIKWHYDGKKNEFVTITISAEERFDTLLSLFGPDGTLAISDDDSGTGLNAEILEFQLPAAGTYTIFAGSASGTGLATVTLTSSPKQGGGELTIGQVETGTLDAGRLHHWKFTGKSGQLINLSLTSAEFDTFLELHDSQGAILVESDDDNESTNSRIDQFILPADDVYTAVVRGLSNNDAGAYEIKLLLDTIPPGGGLLTPDNLTKAVLLPNQDNTWHFEVPAGVTITVQTNSTLLDTFLELYGPDQALLISDDDSGGGLNAAIEDFSIETGGEYQLRVTSAQENLHQGGVYEIVLSVTPKTDDTEQAEVSIEPDDTSPTDQSSQIKDEVAGTDKKDRLLPEERRISHLAPGEQPAWIFEANQGAYINIWMESSTIDTHLSLYNSQGTLLVLNDDFDGNQAAIINFVAPKSDQYRIVGRAYAPDESGDYSISLQITDDPIP